MSSNIFLHECKSKVGYTILRKISHKMYVNSSFNRYYCLGFTVKFKPILTQSCKIYANCLTNIFSKLV